MRNEILKVLKNISWKKVLKEILIIYVIYRMSEINIKQRKELVRNKIKNCKRCNVKTPFCNILPLEVCNKIDVFYQCKDCKKTLELIKLQEDTPAPAVPTCAASASA